ncbi:MAG: IS66 family insertion sequence element accessory protein TnpA [Pirellula sp.]
MESSKRSSRAEFCSQKELSVQSFYQWKRKLQPTDRTALNDCLKDRAGQFDRRDLSRTLVAMRANEFAVAGFYAISAHSVDYDVLPESGRRDCHISTYPWS